MTIITDYSESPAAEGKPYGVTWVLTVPWAHPFWDQYLVSLCDLTTKHEDGTEPVIVRPGMTHEMMIWAINPKIRITKWEDRPSGALLSPANHGYQFKADSDEAARDRIAGYIAQIEAQKLSPDTDWRGGWNKLFKDGASLHYSAFERAAATVQ
jgi:hypothetical protein